MPLGSYPLTQTSTKHSSKNNLAPQKTLHKKHDKSAMSCKLRLEKFYPRGCGINRWETYGNVSRRPEKPHSHRQTNPSQNPPQSRRHRNHRTPRQPQLQSQRPTTSPQKKWKTTPHGRRSINPAKSRNTARPKNSINSWKKQCGKNNHGFLSMSRRCL